MMSQLVAREACDLPVFKVDYVCGASREAENVARHKVLVLADAYDKRRTLAGGNHFVGGKLAYYREPVGSLDVP